MASRGAQLDHTAKQSSDDEFVVIADQSADNDIKPSAYRALQRGRQVRRDEMDERMMLIELDSQW